MTEHRQSSTIPATKLKISKFIDCKPFTCFLSGTWNGPTRMTCIEAVDTPTNDEEIVRRYR